MCVEFFLYGYLSDVAFCAEDHRYTHTVLEIMK